MPQPYCIQIGEAGGALIGKELAALLEQVMPVKFGLSGPRKRGTAGEILAEDATDWASSGGPEAVSTLRVVRREGHSANPAGIVVGVSFGDAPDVPFPFRGRSLRAEVTAEPTILFPPTAEWKVLARCERGPVWLVRSAGGVRHYRSGFSLPVVTRDGTLKDILNEVRFLEILPLVHWLRQLTAEHAFEGPPLRACFILDDPNLHWSRYGFADFRQIAAHAATEGYHVSFATIPLDGWFVHRATADIFRGNSRWLSLCVHGNNHTKCELARDYTEAERNSLLQQAILRIQGVERRAGLRVCRVMVPPHGACSEATLRQLPLAGFEAACISHGSLRHHNQAQPWTTDIGYAVSEVIEGCPVLPRWGLGVNTTNAILLAAFLQQPIVLRGHHQDLRDGIEALDRVARMINGLGPVCWSSLTGLSRMSYLQRMDGSLLRVRPLGRRLSIRLPERAEELVVDNPPSSGWQGWRIWKADGEELNIQPGQSVSLGGAFNGTVTAEALVPGVVRTSNPSRLPAVGALLRRLLTEGRDRFVAPYQASG